MNMNKIIKKVNSVDLNVTLEDGADFKVSAIPKDNVPVYANIIAEEMPEQPWIGSIKKELRFGIEDFQIEKVMFQKAPEGHWITRRPYFAIPIPESENCYECSVCGAFGKVGGWGIQQVFHYCPYCGARMATEAEDVE